MQEIRELLHVIKQNGLTYKTVSDKLVGVPSQKVIAFLEGVDALQIATDEKAAEVLFPAEKEKTKFRKFKAELKGRLYDLIVQLNTNQSRFTDYQKAYYYCHRQWLVVKILTGLNANTSAIGLAYRLLKTAEKYTFTLLCMDISSYLSIQYGVREHDSKKYLWAEEQVEYWARLYHAESKAERYYTYLIAQFSSRKKGKEELLETAVRYSDQVSDYMSDMASYRLQMYGYLLCILRNTIKDDYMAALVCANEAIEFFQGLSYEARVPLQIFYYQSLVCHIQLKQFDTGAEVAQKCIDLMAEGSFNWFKYQDLYFLMLLHTGEYEKAKTVLKLNLNHSKFEFLPDNVKEVWYLYEAYIYYLALCEKVTYTSKFKLSKFINDTSILTKDKSGKNVAIIIIRYVILLREQKLSRLLDEVETLQQYCYNYLRGEHTRRSFALLKMLLTIPMAQYDPELVTEKVTRFKQTLEEAPFDLNNQTFEVEILPFEVIWSLALEGLQLRKQQLQQKKGK